MTVRTFSNYWYHQTRATYVISMLGFYFDILLINNHSLTSLSCNMQPRRSDTYAATTLSSMCSPAFCRAAEKQGTDQSE